MRSPLDSLAPGQTLTSGAWFLFILAAYALLSSWQARTNVPWDNEAWFASPALNLLQHGFMGTTILESKGTWMEGMDQHTYWILPLHVLAQSAWYKIFGFGLLSLRSLSIFWGAVILLSWYSLIVKLCQDRRIALLATALLAVDSHFTFVTALGRMDAMCAGLGWAGCAVYVGLRERSFTTAILLSHAFVAASCLTHPCGALYIVALSTLNLFYDKSRVGIRELTLAAIPYVAALSAWGFYVLQNPTQFSHQFGGNISGIASEFIGADRWAGMRSPINGFRREIARYFFAYGWYSAPNLWIRSQVGLLLIYALGSVGAILTPAIRRQPGAKVLILCGGLLFVVMALFEGLKASVYVVHTLPLAAALVATCFAHFVWHRDNAERQPRIRKTIIATLIVFACLQLVYGIQANLTPHEKWDYQAMLAYLTSHGGRSAQIIGAGELAFDLGFDANLIDDPRLGYYSGKQPTFIVANAIYFGWFSRSQERYPEIQAHIQRVLNTRYREVFHNSSYKIYERIEDR